MTDFPLPTKQDVAKYGLESEDVGIRSEMEGGYVLTRPRTTRRPRRIWITGFTGLLQSDFDTFYSFWETHGTYLAFTYTVKYSNEVVTVRFQQAPTFTWHGVGAVAIWDVDTIRLEEV